MNWFVYVVGVVMALMLEDVILAWRARRDPPESQERAWQRNYNSVCLCMVSGINCAVWITYGVAQNMLALWIANVIGVVSQLGFLLAMCYRIGNARFMLFIVVLSIGGSLGAGLCILLKFYCEAGLHVAGIVFTLFIHMVPLLKWLHETFKAKNVVDMECRWILIGGMENILLWFSYKLEPRIPWVVYSGIYVFMLSLFQLLRLAKASGTMEVHPSNPLQVEVAGAFLV